MSNQSLTHVELIASLSDEERRNLVEKSDLPGLVRIGSHLALIVTTGLWIAFQLPLWQMVMVIHGILLSFLFAAEHESIHGTAFKTYHFSIWTARVAGFILLLPPQWFRYFHFAHHRHTNDQIKDPELASPRPSTLLQYVWHISGIPYWMSQSVTLLRNAFKISSDAYIPERGRGRVQVEARFFVCLYLLFFVGSYYFATDILIYIWVLPALLGQPFLRMALLAEHLFCPHESNMLHNSRTTFTTILVRWITWNMAFHAEHHSYPAVPFHRLPMFHEHTCDHTLVKQEGYAKFHADAVSKLASRGL